MTGTSGGTFRVAVKNGWRICSGGPAPINVFADGFRAYREGCKEFGTDSYVGYVRAIFLADDEAAAHREAKEAILNFYAFNVKPHDSLVGDKEMKQRLIEAGYGFYASDLLQQMKELSYDDIID